MYKDRICKCNSGKHYREHLLLNINLRSLSSTDCFAVSQLFSVARHVGRFKLGSKPAQIYVRLCILLISQQMTYGSSGIIRHYVVAFICLQFGLLNTRVLNSLEELCITVVAAVNSFARVFTTPRKGWISSVLRKNTPHSWIPSIQKSNDSCEKLIESANMKCLSYFI